VLVDHRRALWYAVGLLSALALVFVGVGVHPVGQAPRTSLRLIGEWDLSIYRWMDDVRSGPLTLVTRGLNVLGAGVVTIPLRLVVAAWLAIQTRWRAFTVWVATWAVAELVLGIAKATFHRGRPPGALVQTVGYSFPSGHAVAGASIAVALVLVSMPAGPERRRWEWAAAAFAFVMASSRVYLLAHWFSDVVAGVLLGSGVAVGTAALVTEIRNRLLHRPVSTQRTTEPADRASGPPARERSPWPEPPGGASSTGPARRGT
jgi:membrane-associated phospholipid phosphatase